MMSFSGSGLDRVADRGYPIAQRSKDGRLFHASLKTRFSGYSWEPLEKRLKDHLFRVRNFPAPRLGGMNIVGT